MSSDHYLEDRAEKRIILLMTSGPSTPHRCATPFYLGSVLASMDNEVSIFFTMEGVKLMERGVPEELAPMEGGKKIIEFIRDSKRVGVRLHVCKPALPGYRIEADEDLIDEVDEVLGAGGLADQILNCDHVITF
ncbi:MAG: sulfur reduction protein DsrE [Gammaproteobacteria bacterium]|nr:sulfur reduction protein DsrE [Gammaproteobacteria bacterium]NIR85506.1 sulfur reduction protein DsrE [Gammaproteobacteria bacterium]NIU06643.1 sulfur reduction protein DsrE [Gammaproteobacteria bacterium]NIX87916.1 sulfur reduction protein DsrE [Gammaproteobacteria bacterium]